MNFVSSLLISILTVTGEIHDGNNGRILKVKNWSPGAGYRGVIANPRFFTSQRVRKTDFRTAFRAADATFVLVTRSLYLRAIIIGKNSFFFSYCSAYDSRLSSAEAKIILPKERIFFFFPCGICENNVWALNPHPNHF